ncbi:MAG TPA: hypothetical protein VI215_10585 [Bacteroidota bacterium]|jgi:hypothetical protein
MKYRSGPLNTVKLLFKPPERRYRFLCARRADLISLISEMEKNRRLQAAPWQIESLRQTLHTLEDQLSRSLRKVPPGRPADMAARPFQFGQGRRRHLGPV